MSQPFEKSEKRSPLKRAPPRVPGQSVDEELTKFFDEEVMPWFILSLFVILYAMLEWFRWLGAVYPHPALVTILALLITALCLMKVLSHRKRIRAIKQGRDGEREVGAMLEDLRKVGCTVIHDLVGDRFNIDHIILSTRGLFSIETKTLSKLPGDCQATYDGEHLHIPGLGSYTQAVHQARASASSLQKLCRELTGSTYAVRPVVCLPGWYVHSDTPGWRHETWVFNPSQVIQFISGAPESIPPAELQALVFHLRQHLANQASQVK